MAVFRDLTERMDAAILASLNDGAADYVDAAGLPVASGVTVIVDRNLERTGADGMFLAIPLAVSWRKADLASVGRGGVFTVGVERYLVESIVGDDGHFVTASCMEAP